MGKNRRSNSAVMEVSSNEWTGPARNQPVPEEMDWYMELVDETLDSSEGGDYDDASRINQKWRENQIVGNDSEVPREEAIKELSAQFGISEKRASNFIDKLKAMGWQYIGTSNFRNDNSSLDFKKDGQYLSFEPEFMQNIFDGNFTVQPTTLFRHMDKEMPQVYKWYNGRTLFTMDEKGGDYDLKSNTIRLNSRLFRKGKMTADGQKVSKNQSGLNYQQFWEHEATHRFDTFGGNADLFGGSFSQHPYMQHLIYGSYVSSYYGKKKLLTPAGHAENLAEATNIFAKRNGKISNPQGSGRADGINQREFLEATPWADVGYALRNSKSPREFKNFLDGKWNEFLKNNS